MSQGLKTLLHIQKPLQSVEVRKWYTNHISACLATRLLLPSGFEPWKIPSAPCLPSSELLGPLRVLLVSMKMHCNLPFTVARSSWRCWKHPSFSLPYYCWWSVHIKPCWRSGKKTSLWGLARPLTCISALRCCLQFCLCFTENTLFFPPLGRMSKGFMINKCGWEPEALLLTPKIQPKSITSSHAKLKTHY